MWFLYVSYISNWKSSFFELHFLTPQCEWWPGRSPWSTTEHTKCVHCTTCSTVQWLVRMNYSKIGIMYVHVPHRVYRRVVCIHVHHGLIMDTRDSKLFISWPGRNINLASRLRMVLDLADIHMSLGHTETVCRCIDPESTGVTCYLTGKYTADLESAHGCITIYTSLILCATLNVRKNITELLLRYSKNVQSSIQMRGYTIFVNGELHTIFKVVPKTLSLISV